MKVNYIFKSDSCPRAENPEDIKLEDEKGQTMFDYVSLT